MSDARQRRAAWFAHWGALVLKGLTYLHEHGRKADADALERGLRAVLDLAEAEVGAAMLNAEIRKACEYWDRADAPKSCRRPH